MAVMFNYQFEPLNTFTIIISLAAFLGIYLSIIVAWWVDQRGYPPWASRKIIHTGIGTIIAFVLVIFDNLSGPLLTLVLFFLPLLISQVQHRSVTRLVSLAKRENGNKISTLSAGISAIVVYAIVFIILPEHPEIFVSSILVVSWGDGAGEVFGRTLGRHNYSIFGNEKSIEGSIAVGLFSIIALTISLIWFTAFHLLSAVPYLIVIALVVIFVEAISPKWTDNLFIPVSVSILLFLAPL
jgi:phytol kinase